MNLYGRVARLERAARAGASQVGKCPLRDPALFHPDATIGGRSRDLLDRLLQGTCGAYPRPDE
jgi:hypothetical protein